MDVASSGGSKTRREWRGHCDNKGAGKNTQKAAKSPTSSSWKIKRECVKRVELRKAWRCVGRLVWVWLVVWLLEVVGVRERVA